jgi:hypothetical protein
MSQKPTDKRLDQAILWTALSQRQYHHQEAQHLASARGPVRPEQHPKPYEQKPYQDIRTYLLSHVDNAALDHGGSTALDGEGSIWSEFVEVLDDLHQVITETGMETSLEGAVQLLTEATDDELVDVASDSLVIASGSSENFIEDEGCESIVIGYYPTEATLPQLPVYDRHEIPERGYHGTSGAAGQYMLSSAQYHATQLQETSQTSTGEEMKQRPVIYTESPLSKLVRTLTDNQSHQSKADETQPDQRYQEAEFERTTSFARSELRLDTNAEDVPERDTDVDEATSQPSMSRWSPDSSQSSERGWISTISRQISEWPFSRDKRKRDRPCLHSRNSQKGGRHKLLRQLAEYEPALRLVKKVRKLKRSGTQHQLAELKSLPAEVSPKAMKILGASEEGRGRHR